MRTLKTLVAALTLALIGMIFTPGAAHAAPAQAQLLVTNSVEAGGATITGAEYQVVKTHTVNPETGETTAVTGTTITVIPGTTVNLDQYSIYELRMTKRAPGYYLDDQGYHSYDPAVSDDPERPYTLEFPRMAADGTIAPDQLLKLNPKITPVTGDASLLKTANDETTTPVTGATFSLCRTFDAATNTTTADPGVLVSEGLVTGTNGTISATGLTEGEYYFIETATVAPYATDTTTKTDFP